MIVPEDVQRPVYREPSQFRRRRLIVIGGLTQGLVPTYVYVPQGSLPLIVQGEGDDIGRTLVPEESLIELTDLIIAEERDGDLGPPHPFLPEGGPDPSPYKRAQMSPADRGRPDAGHLEVYPDTYCHQPRPAVALEAALVEGLGS